MNEENKGKPRESCGGTKLGYIPEYFNKERQDWFPLELKLNYKGFGIPGRPLSFIEHSVGACSYEQAHALAWTYYADACAHSKYDERVRVTTVEIKYDVKAVEVSSQELPKRA